MPRTITLDDGLQHYRVLGLARTATQDDIKQAYRRLARVLHPDKGGSSKAFAALQTAFEVLINPKTRSVYDALAADVRFSPGAAAPYSTANQAAEQSAAAPPPGIAEAVLLHQLLRTCGSSIDPYSQLCVTCEVCRRPATKECWTCRMAICDFCTRRQHWKGSVPLHWPLVNAPGRMVEQLGRQELELKRKEDALEYKKRQPGYRPQFEMLLLREFQDAICDLLKANKQQQGTFGAVAAKRDKGVRSEKLPEAPCKATTAAAATRPFALPAAASAAHIRPDPSHLNSSSSSSRDTSDLVTTNSSRQLLDTNSSTRLLAVPGSSSSSNVNKCFRAWQAASPEAIRLLQTTYDIRLARFYMWAQTDSSILLTVHLPTGGTSTPPKLSVQATATTLSIQHQGFAPVLNRCWSLPVDSSQGVTSWSSSDGQLMCMVVPKAQPGRTWNTCFTGDSHHARCLKSPYSVLQLPHEVHIELPLPFWVLPEEDLEVTINDMGVTVVVDGVMQLQRQYWRAGSQDAKAINTAASSWCVIGQQQQVKRAPASAETSQQQQQQQQEQKQQKQQHRPDKTLSISLTLPELTLDEKQYKKGVRQNNAAACRSCPYGYDEKGCSFFADDEDEFGLGPVLQALVFHEAGFTWVTPKPWEIASGAVTGLGFSETGCEDLGLGGRWVRSEGELPTEVRKHLEWLRAAAESGAGRVDAVEN